MKKIYSLSILVLVFSASAFAGGISEAAISGNGFVTIGGISVSESSGNYLTVANDRELVLDGTLDAAGFLQNGNQTDAFAAAWTAAERLNNATYASATEAAVAITQLAQKLDQDR